MSGQVKRVLPLVSTNKLGIELLEPLVMTLMGIMTAMKMALMQDLNKLSGFHIRTHKNHRRKEVSLN